MNLKLSASIAMICLTMAGATSAATTCTADVARMKRLEDRSPAMPASSTPLRSGLTVAELKSLARAGARVPSNPPAAGETAADLPMQNRMPPAGRGRDIAGSCL